MFLSFVLILSVQRKLRTFREEACKAFSPQGSVPNTCRPSAPMRRNVHLRTRFQSLRRRLKSRTVSVGIKKKQIKRQRKMTELSVSGASEDNQTSNTIDDIDDIFASAGLWHYWIIHIQENTILWRSICDTFLCLKREHGWNIMNYYMRTDECLSYEWTFYKSWTSAAADSQYATRLDA